MEGSALFGDDPSDWLPLDRITYEPCGGGLLITAVAGSWTTVKGFNFAHTVGVGEGTTDSGPGKAKVCTGGGT